MPRQRKADRRPEYASHHRWCCRACQELHQLRRFALDDRKKNKHQPAAMKILYHFELVEYGQYGGIELADLFD